jgi:hypothetical protein
VASEQLVEIYNAAYSRFRVEVPLTEAGLRAAEDAHEQIRRARWGLKISRAFDFEMCFAGAARAEEVRGALEQLREGAHAPQLVGCKASGELEEMAAIARQHQVTLSFAYAGEAGEALGAVRQATGGRFDYRVNSVADAEIAAEYLL